MRQKCKLCELCQLLLHILRKTDETRQHVRQESRAAARKPRDAASVLFG